MEHLSLKIPVIGVKLNLKGSRASVHTMVFLQSLSRQWPWNPNAPQDLSDKEIYTHRILLEDASNRWRVPILPPMNGYAYTGFRLSVYGRDEHYTSVSHLVLGETEKGMFGLPYDQSVAKNKTWTLLGYPLTHKMIAICEDGLDLLIPHHEACCGQVEFVAQRFEDILEDESDLSYAFLDSKTNEVAWILNQTNLMYRPSPVDGPIYPRKTKLVPSMLRLFDAEAQWPDTFPFWNSVNIHVPLLQ